MKIVNALVITSVLFCLAACNQKTVLTIDERNTVSELTAKLTPRCVGRYLVDMPDGVQEFGGISVNDVKFDTKAMTHQEFGDEIRNREVELKATKNVTGYQFLYENVEISGDGIRYFVRLGSEVDSGDVGRVVEAYKWDRGYRFRMEIEGWDYTKSKFKSEPTFQKMEPKNNIPEKIRIVLDLLKRVRGRQDNEIPTEPGVCFRGGFLQGRVGENENVRVQFVLRDKIDVSFEFESDANIKEPDTLLQRGGNIGEMLGYSDGKTIRKGSVPLPGIAAEEWLMARKTVLNVPGHLMILEGNARAGSALTPLINLIMENGSSNNLLTDRSVYKIEKASLTEGEAISLWDAISRTLRPRQNGF